MKNRNKVVLEYLKQGNTLTTHQASQLFNITGLPGVIFRLREQGWMIEAEMRQSFHGSTYAVYRLQPTTNRKVFGL